MPSNDTRARMGRWSVEADTPTWFKASFITETREEADAEAARFPKYVRLRVGKLFTYEGQAMTPSYRTYEAAIITFNASFNANKTTGERNETSEKRLAKFREIAGV